MILFTVRIYLKRNVAILGIDLADLRHPLWFFGLKQMDADSIVKQPA